MSIQERIRRVKATSRSNPMIHGYAVPIENNMIQYMPPPKLKPVPRFWQRCDYATTREPGKALWMGGPEYFINRHTPEILRDPRKIVFYQKDSSEDEAVIRRPMAEVVPEEKGGYNSTVNWGSIEDMTEDDRNILNAHKNVIDRAEQALQGLNMNAASKNDIRRKMYAEIITNYGINKDTPVYNSKGELLDSKVASMRANLNSLTGGRATKIPRVKVDPNTSTTAGKIVGPIAVPTLDSDSTPKPPEKKEAKESIPLTPEGLKKIKSYKRHNVDPRKPNEQLKIPDAHILAMIKLADSLTMSEKNDLRDKTATQFRTSAARNKKIKAVYKSVNDGSSSMRPYINYEMFQNIMKDIVEDMKELRGK
jgi:hypothetical protein